MDFTIYSISKNSTVISLIFFLMFFHLTVCCVMESKGNKKPKNFGNKYIFLGKAKYDV